MTSRGGSSITYTSYNLPSLINSGTNSSALSYGAFRNRYKQVAVTSGVTETTIYVAGLLEKVTKSGGTEYRRRIHGGSGIAALYTRRTSGWTLISTYYIHTDHLGSPELITDSAGAQVVKLSFGAYGERRDSDWDGAVSAADQTTIGNTWRGGFTGHEHLDAVGLIHMNGRVYDPVVARFLSRDPFIDGVDSSQGPNGYAYVQNNPLNRVDPSGFVNFCAVDIPCRTINPGDPFYQSDMDRFARNYVSERSAQNRPWDDSISLENLPPPSFVSFANYVQRPLAVFTGLLMDSTTDGANGEGDDLHSGYVFFYQAIPSRIGAVTGELQYGLDAMRACDLQRSCGEANGLFDDILLAILPIGRPTSAAFSRLSVAGGLAAHEGVLGGHTLARHVNIGSLARRLADEPLLSAASKFVSREVAETSIATALDVNQAMIRNWLRESSGSLLIAHRFASPIGETLVRGAVSSTPASSVTVVLRRYPGFREGFRIHTAYPGL